MSKFTRLQRVLLILIMILVIFSCVMLGLRQNTLSNMGYSVWTYIRYGLIDYPLESLGNMTSDLATLWSVYDDNVYLNQQLAAQKSYQTLYEEERNRNQELSGLLGLESTQPNARKVPATVMSRSGQSWNDEVTVSAGSQSGVEVGMIAATSQGAVGVVSEVQDATSTVTLLTSTELPNAIAIKLALEDGTSVEGVLQNYDAKRKAYRISLFDNDAKVVSGLQVATSGEGGNYPGGIMIGTVTESSIDDAAIVSTVYAKPVSNIGSFDYVLLLGPGAVQ